MLRTNGISISCSTSVATCNSSTEGKQMTMALEIDAKFGERKDELLQYLRSRTKELRGEVTRKYGTTQFKKRASALNKALGRELESLVSVVNQAAVNDKWSTEDLLRARLMLMHCVNVTMLESRNEVWPYEYMAFSRRIGELWEPFITTCFDLPVSDDVTLFIPPLFDDIRARLTTEVREFIANLDLSAKDRTTLLEYYDQVWQLVTSGEIKIELDLHFLKNKLRHVVDCKSGFSSNEKGNTNRLLLVASIYKNIEPEDYRCMLFVRSAEDENNNYLQTLKNSGLWDVFCGDETYRKVQEFSGFDLGAWIVDNIDWKSDIDEGCYKYLTDQDLIKYLIW